MFRSLRVTLVLALLAASALSGCAALQEIAALRTVSFAFAHVSDVRFVGIPIGLGADYSRLGFADVARVAAAVLAKEAPLELVAHVNATNPSANKVAARMVEMGWKFYLDDKQALAGQLGAPVVIEPGQTADVPVAVRIDLVQLQGGSARELYDFALAIAGQGTVKQDLRLELTPTIQTSIGPITYPSPIVITRAGQVK